MSFGPLFFIYMRIYTHAKYILYTVLWPCAQRCPKEQITLAEIRLIDTSLGRLFMNRRCKARSAFCLIKNILSVSRVVLKADTV